MVSESRNSQVERLMHRVDSLGVSASPAAQEAPGSGVPASLVREASACGQRSQSPLSPGSLFQMLVCNKTSIEKERRHFFWAPGWENRFCLNGKTLDMSTCKMPKKMFFFLSQRYCL